MEKRIVIMSEPERPVAMIKRHLDPDTARCGIDHGASGRPGHEPDGRIRAPVQRKGAAKGWPGAD